MATTLIWNSDCQVPPIFSIFQCVFWPLLSPYIIIVCWLHYKSLGDTSEKPSLHTILKHEILNWLCHGWMRHLIAVVPNIDIFILERTNQLGEHCCGLLTFICSLLFFFFLHVYTFIVSFHNGTFTISSKFFGQWNTRKVMPPELKKKKIFPDFGLPPLLFLIWYNYYMKNFQLVCYMIRGM